MNEGNDKQLNGGAQESKEEMEKARDKLERAKIELQKAESAWDDAGFIEGLKKKAPDEKEEAVRLKQEIGTKLLMIENVQIGLVTQRVKENSRQLEFAITDLENALQTLSNVTKILNATGSLLSLIGRILAL